MVLWRATRVALAPNPACLLPRVKPLCRPLRPTLLRSQHPTRRLVPACRHAPSPICRALSATLLRAGRFNERLVLSLAASPACLLMDDELNVLPTSGEGRALAPASAATGDAELAELVESLTDTQVRPQGLGFGEPGGQGRGFRRRSGAALRPAWNPRAGAAGVSAGTAGAQPSWHARPGPLPSTHTREPAGTALTAAAAGLCSPPARSWRPARARTRPGRSSPSWTQLPRSCCAPPWPSRPPGAWGRQPVGPRWPCCRRACPSKLVAALLSACPSKLPGMQPCMGLQPGQRAVTCCTTSAHSTEACWARRRGRGKSAAVGLAVAGAIALSYSNVFVTAPSPENLRTLFQFVLQVGWPGRCSAGARTSTRSGRQAGASDGQGLPLT